MLPLHLSIYLSNFFVIYILFFPFVHDVKLLYDLLMYPNVLVE